MYEWLFMAIQQKNAIFLITFAGMMRRPMFSQTNYGDRSKNKTGQTYTRLVNGQVEMT